MATIQSKTSRGYKYWYIVESRRVNGKPRPVVLSYLGTAENLLQRLQGTNAPIKVKSYTHGAVAALLKVVSELQVPELINNYIEAQRPYFAEKPVRHNLTAGMTLVLAAIGRACMPTSKRKWRQWAKTTSCEFLLRAALSKVDSQHFWDMMDALPAEAIPQLEAELLKRIQKHYHVSCETLAYDTTNFFTFIDTTNSRCTLAQRTKSKQKRHDLRNVGLAMVLGGVIGIEREFAAKPAGLRTHMLVAGAAALMVGLGDMFLVHLHDGAQAEIINADPIRIVQSVILGISFLGAGTIIRHSSTRGIAGLTTAASILFSSTVGMCVALELFFLSIGVTMLALLILTGLGRVEQKVARISSSS